MAVTKLHCLGDQKKLQLFALTTELSCCSKSLAQPFTKSSCPILSSMFCVPTDLGSRLLHLQNGTRMTKPFMLRSGCGGRSVSDENDKYHDGRVSQWPLHFQLHGLKIRGKREPPGSHPCVNDWLWAVLLGKAFRQSSKTSYTDKENLLLDAVPYLYCKKPQNPGQFTSPCDKNVNIPLLSWPHTFVFFQAKLLETLLHFSGHNLWQFSQTTNWICAWLKFSLNELPVKWKSLSTLFSVHHGCWFVSGVKEPFQMSNVMQESNVTQNWCLCFDTWENKQNSHLHEFWPSIYRYLALNPNIEIALSSLVW